MNVQTNVDIEFEVDIDDLLNELDINEKVVAVLEEQLDEFLSSIKDGSLCSLGRSLQASIQATVRDMLGSSE
jgi:hypothetical protein